MQRFNLSLKLKDKKHGGNLLNGQTGCFDELIHVGRIESERIEQPLIIGIMATAGLHGFFGHLILHKTINQRGELGQDVIGALDELCALPDQLVTTSCQRVVNRTRNGEYFTTLLTRQACRDERTTSFRRFDDERAQGQATDEAIALRKVFATR